MTGWITKLSYNKIVSMKKRNISIYCKLATVLLIDSIPVFFTIRVTTADNVDSDFLGFGLMIIFFFFLLFNMWAFIIYYFTKFIKRLWLRDTLFYILALSFFLFPFVLG